MIKKLLEALGLIAVFVIIVYLSTLLIGNVFDNYYEKSLKDYGWIEDHVELVKDESIGEDIYVVDKHKKITTYNTKYQEAIESNYQTLKEEANYTFENPLLIMNPYGTNSLGLNIYFETENDTKLEYTIKVKSDKKINEFTRTAFNEEEYSKNHEYQIIGLVAGNVNEIEFKLIDKDGNEKTNKMIVNLSKLETLSQLKLKTKNGESKEQLTNGLYTLLGNDSPTNDYVAMYDNNGILRMEIPIIGYRAHKILFTKDRIYFSISQTRIVEMDRLGRVTNIFRTGKYQLHHDYVFDNEGNMLVLANDTTKETEEDCLIKIDLKTKEVTEVIDFQGMFYEYAKTCYHDTTAIKDEGEDGLDWLHLNSILFINGDVLLSSRETSSIIKVKDIYGEQKLEYMLTDKYLWEDTKFERYVYEKKGDFLIHAGQHSLNYVPTEDEKVYYIHFYNNNYGKANSKPDKDYAKVGLKNTTTPFQGDNSYYYVYKVNEHDRTFEKVEEIALPYSGIVSSVQLLEDNVITDSGTAGVFAEYDKDNKLIKSYKVDLNNYFVYRVIKYDFTEFLFRN